MVAKVRDAGFFVSLSARHGVVTFARPKDPVHVRLGHPVGVRHRLMLDRVKNGSGTYTRPLLTAARTACNISIADRYYAPLEESLEGELCTRCFTPDEILTAVELQQAEELRTREEAALWERERVEHNERALAERQERIRRFKTGEAAPVETPEPEPKDDE